MTAPPALSATKPRTRRINVRTCHTALTKNAAGLVLMLACLAVILSDSGKFGIFHLMAIIYIIGFTLELARWRKALRRVRREGPYDEELTTNAGVQPSAATLYPLWALLWGVLLVLVLAINALLSLVPPSSLWTVWPLLVVDMVALVMLFFSARHLSKSRRAYLADMKAARVQATQPAALAPAPTVAEAVQATQTPTVAPGHWWTQTGLRNEVQAPAAHTGGRWQDVPEEPAVQKVGNTQ